LHHSYHLGDASADVVSQFMFPIPQNGKTCSLKTAVNSAIAPLVAVQFGAPERRMSLGVVSTFRASMPVASIDKDDNLDLFEDKIWGTAHVTWTNMPT
jgi:hypothetical protein